MNDVLKNMTGRYAKWLTGEGKYSDIIISSRARLARNLQNFPFVTRTTEDQRSEILSSVLDAAKDSKILNSLYFFDMSAVDELDAQFLKERHIISHEFIGMSDPKGFFFSEDESIGIMINEEDHIRMQVIHSGFSLNETWFEIHRLDEEFSKKLSYAYSDRFGYLTACPTNVGTGVRFSVFVHLPVLTFTKRIDKIFADLIPAGITVRGLYGEGSKVIGNFFQISNQYTLGWTEQGIMDRVIPIIRQFISEEKKARENIMNDQRIVIEDKIYRTIGILSKAMILSSMEFLDHLSALRLGVDLGILPKISKRLLNELLIMTQPAHIQKIHGRKLEELERDSIRAEMVREKLNLN